MIQKIKSLILKHKIISIIVCLVIVIGAYYLLKSKTSGETKYVLENVKRGNIENIVTGTGQIEASNTITLKPGATGNITYVGVKVGQEVKKGTLIASVDSRDAKIALENAKISLAKLTTPDSLTLLQKQNTLNESYDNSWNTVSLFISEAGTILNNLDNIYSNDGYLGYSNITKLSSSLKKEIDSNTGSFYKAQKSLNELSKIYQSLSRTSDREDISNLTDQAYETSKILALAVKDAQTAVNLVSNDLDIGNDSNTISTKADVSSWLDDSNGYVKNLLSAINSIKEDSESLEDTIQGGDELDIRSAELSLESKQNAYNDCFVYAPFDGVIATLTAKVGESSGSSIGTIITNQKIATIPFNEVDIVSIKLGQKTRITLDAIEDLSVLGVVAEVDPIGTVSSGVVTYDVKIALDSNDERIKPGMSISVEIVTEEKNDVLIISSEAIKTIRSKSYVEIFENPITVSKNQNVVTSDILPMRKEIKIGLSDDTNTEIIEGLNEGNQIVSKEITGNVSSTSNNNKNSSSAFRSFGGGPMGGEFRPN